MFCHNLVTSPYVRRTGTDTGFQYIKNENGGKRQKLIFNIFRYFLFCCFFSIFNSHYDSFQGFIFINLA